MSKFEKPECYSATISLNSTEITLPKYPHAVTAFVFSIAVVSTLALSCSFAFAESSPLLQGTTAGQTNVVTSSPFTPSTTAGQTDTLPMSPITPTTTGGQTDLTTLVTGTPGESEPLQCDLPGGPMCGVAQQQDATSTHDSMMPMTQVGNPVSVITGNKYQRESDYQSSVSKLQFNRHYNSLNANSNFGVGMGWTSTYSTKIVKKEYGGYEIVQGTGQRINFDIELETEYDEEAYRSHNYAMGTVSVNGNKSVWSMSDGRQIHFTGSTLVRIDYPGASFLNLIYRNGRLAIVEDEADRRLQFQYYASNAGLQDYSETEYRQQPGHLASLTLPGGETIEYDYDKYANLSRVRYADGTSRIFEYENVDHPNHLTSIVDRNGVKYAAWSYHDDGRAASSTHANGVEKLDIYYTQPSPGEDIGYTTVINALGEYSEYAWQRDHQTGQSALISSYGPGCSTCPVSGMNYTYNEQLQLSTAIHDSGRKTRVEYDDIGRVSNIYAFSPGSNEVHKLGYEYEGTSPLPVRVTKPSIWSQGRHIVEIEYNNEKLPVRITESGFSPIENQLDQFEPITRSTEIVYSNGLIASIDGPRNDVSDITHFEYDDLGRVTQIIMPTGQVMRLSEFDSHGRATQFQTGKQSPLTMQYDAHGSIVELSQHGESITYQYDAEGRLTGLAGPDGKSIALEYDNAGRLTKTVDGLGIATEFINDVEGRITGKSFYGLDGSLLRSISYAFDAEGRLKAANEQSTNHSTNTPIHDDIELQYDQYGQLISRIDPSTGNHTDIAYDALGRISGIIQAGQEVAQISYDAKGQDIGFTDSRNNSTQYLKDDFGRVVVLISPDTGTTHYRYDESDNRIRKVNANGDVFTYQWDAGDRLIREDNPSDTHTYEYHPSNGRLTRSSNNTTIETFAYNNEAQLIEHTRELDGHSLRTGYRYAVNGKITKKLLPDGQTLNYHYYDSGPNRGGLRAITRETLLGLSQETIVAEIDMNKRDGTSGYVAHNGVRTNEQYYPNGEIKSIDAINTLSLDYTFDDDGNITGIIADDIQQSYYYQNGNLSQASTTLGDFHYLYDSADNRIVSGKSLLDGTEEGTFYDYGGSGSGNRLLSTTDELNGQTNNYEYDSAGALLATDNGYTYKYNADQRPTAVYENGDLIAEYHYNSFGERVKKVVYDTSGTKITYYLYDGKSLSAEVNVDGEVNSQYVYLEENKPVVKLVGKQRYAIHTDHIGTPRRLSDDAGQLVWDADYEPFGKASVLVELVEMNLRLPGQYLDAETDTHYNYFRQYDPATGRYITSDPIGLQGGANTYTYANNLPVGLTDVLGLSTDPESPTPVLVKPESDSFESKMGAVIDYAIQKLEKDGKDAIFAKALEDFKDTALILGGLAVALGVGIAAAGAATGGAAVPVALAGLGAAAAAIGARALWITGFQGVAFIYKLIKIGMDVAITDHEDCAGLQKAGDDLFNLAVDTGSEVVQNVVTFGLGKIVEKLSDAFKVAKNTGSTAGLCSFHGNTLVLTRNGKKRIRDVVANRDQVFAQDEATGRTSWKQVVAAYSNQYKTQIHITATNARGIKQKITSNKIHPFFTRIAAASVIAVSSASYAHSSEGHVYNGPIDGGRWVDAQYLEAGSELLTQNNEWLTVQSIEQEESAFRAYNLTVDDYSTYYVSGNEEADSVWVHNKCWDEKPPGYEFRGSVVWGKQTYVNGLGEQIYRAFDVQQGRYRWFSRADHPITRTTLFGTGPTSAGASQNGLNTNMKNNGYKPETGGPYQAHHIVTWENWKNDGPVKNMLDDIKFNMNHPDNGIYLPETGCGTIHNGCHPAYSNAMKGMLDRLANAYDNNNLTGDEVSEYISAAILKARQNFGQPNTGAGGVDLKTGDWDSIFRTIF